MSNLKINITLGPFKVELEGEEATVVSQFETIKKEGLGQIVDQLVPIVNQPSANQHRLQNPEIASSETSHDVLAAEADKLTSTISTMSLKDIALKGLPSTESEWIVIYADDILKVNQDTFTREELIDKYKVSNRFSRNRIKNLSNSIKTTVVQGWISALNDRDFVLTDDGRAKIQEILQRPKGVIKSPTKRKMAGKTPVTSINE